MPPNGGNVQRGHSWTVRLRVCLRACVFVCVCVWWGKRGKQREIESIGVCVRVRAHRAEVCACLVMRMCLCISHSSCGHASCWCHSGPIRSESDFNLNAKRLERQN